MKKATSIILVLIFSCNIIVSSENEYTEEGLEIAQMVLLDLGLWEDFNLGAEYVTRAEAVAYICMMYNIYEEFTQNPSGDKYALFQDVDIDHWAYDYIYFLYILTKPINQRVLEGDGNGNIRPDDYITWSECIKLITTTLGWSPYAYLNGQYPDGYFYVAGKLGLYPVNEDEKDEFINKSDLIILIYNAIKVPTFTQDALGLPISLRQDISILQSTKGYLQVRGVAEKIDDSNISIDGKVYQGRVNNEKFNKGFVLCYYKYDNEKDIPKIVTCYPISSLTFDNPIQVSENLPKSL